MTTLIILVILVLAVVLYFVFKKKKNTTTTTTTAKVVYYYEVDVFNCETCEKSGSVIVKSLTKLDINKFYYQSDQFRTVHVNSLSSPGQYSLGTFVGPYSNCSDACDNYSTTTTTAGPIFKAWTVIPGQGCGFTTTDAKYTESYRTWDTIEYFYNSAMLIPNDHFSPSDGIIGYTDDIFGIAKYYATMISAQVTEHVDCGV